MADRICSIEGCEGTIHSRGWCGKHYMRWLTHGDPLYVKPKRFPETCCSIAGCDKPNFHRGWCSMHYSRALRYGDPLWRKRGEVRQGCKMCCKCGLDLPLDAFGTDATTTTGLNTYCRECVCAVAKEHRARKPTYWVTGTDRRRARKSGAQFERFDKVTIFERDGWRCGICGEHIHRVLFFPHFMSASLDHVVPLVAGGPHIPSNVQASHWRCNRAKWAAVPLIWPAT